jgi:hypothetical protein
VGPGCKRRRRPPRSSVVFDVLFEVSEPTTGTPPKQPEPRQQTEPKKPLQTNETDEGRSSPTSEAKLLPVPLCSVPFMFCSDALAGCLKGT